MDKMRMCACGSPFRAAMGASKRCNSCRLLDLFLPNPSKACRCERSELPNSPRCTCGAFPEHRLRRRVACPDCVKRAERERMVLNTRRNSAKSLLEAYAKQGGWLSDRRSLWFWEDE